MKIKNIFFVLVGVSLAISLFSCGGGDNNKIENKKLQPFLLCGVYTLGGYGGGEQYTEAIKQRITTEPGSKQFLKDLSDAYDAYFIFPFKTSDKAGAKRELASWWGNDSKEKLTETLDWLLKEGHQTTYESCRKAIDENGGANADIAAIDLAKYGLDNNDIADLRFVRENLDKFPKGGIKAWDIARYMYNVNLGYATEYFSEEDGQKIAQKALEEAQKHFDNWDDYWNSYLLGYHFWGGDRSEAFSGLVNDMLNKENQYNIYNYLNIK